MSSAAIRQGDECGLAEADVRSNTSSLTTLPDLLANADVVTTSEQQAASRSKMTIRKVATAGPLWPAMLTSIRAVANLLSLPPGWNSYSARPIARQNAVRAIELFAEFLTPTMPAPEVVPRVRGGIQLEWHTEDVDIEIYIDSPEEVRFFAQHAGSAECFEGPLAGEETRLKVWLEQASGK